MLKALPIVIFVALIFLGMPSFAENVLYANEDVMLTDGTNQVGLFKFPLLCGYIPNSYPHPLIIFQVTPGSPSNATHIDLLYSNNASWTETSSIDDLNDVWSGLSFIITNSPGSTYVIDVYNYIVDPTWSCKGNITFGLKITDSDLSEFIGKDTSSDAVILKDQYDNVTYFTSKEQQTYDYSKIVVYSFTPHIFAWSDYIASVVSPYNGTESWFNITWTSNNLGISRAWLEGNWSGSFIDYDMSTEEDGIYFYHDVIPVSNFAVKLCANDTYGYFVNCTGFYYYSVEEEETPPENPTEGMPVLSSLITILLLVGIAVTVLRELVFKKPSVKNFILVLISILVGAFLILFVQGVL